jgi:hypothetical protein
MKGKTMLLRFVALSIFFVPLMAFAQEVVAPVVDPLLSDLGELVQHAKLGRTVLAILAAVILVVRLTLRFGSRIPGAVGAWLGGPIASLVLPGAIGIIGGVITTVANGGAWYDGLIGGIIIAVGAWLPAGKPAPVPHPGSPEVVNAADAASVFRQKGPNP